jgi:hypothetical protein
MCINQILKNEQIELMRYASATDSVDISIHKRRLSMFGHLLEAHPYPHRPYVFQCMPNPVRAGLRALSIVHNEGGAC